MSTAHDRPSCFRVGGIALAYNEPTVCRVDVGGELLHESIRAGAFPAGRCALSIGHNFQQELKPTVMVDFAAHGDDLAFLSDRLPDDDFGWRVLAAFGGSKVRGVSISHAVKKDQRQVIHWPGLGSVSEVRSGVLMAVSLVVDGQPAFPNTIAMLHPA